MPNPLSSRDSYFESNGEFKKKYGTFTDLTIVGDHLSELINNRAPEHAEVFETTTDTLTSELEKNSKAKKDFYELIDECRAFGLVQMTLRRAKHSEYHTPEHAAELSNDTQQSLTEKFEKEFTPDKANRLFIELAKAAACWHDIIQDRPTPPSNEVESAKQFVIYLSEKFETFKQKYKSLAPAITNFQKELDFLSKELIVYDTWLVFGMEPGLTLVAKPLIDRAQLVINDLNANRNEAEKIKIADTPNMKRLYAASETISLGDTKRFGMEHVLKNQLILKGLKSFPPENQKILEDFFKAADIVSAREKEQFLGLMCQNIRIFPELNKPEKTENSKSNNDKLISVAEHDSYVKICDDLKSPNNYSLNRRHSALAHAMFDNFMNIENVKGKSNISREIDFAKAQQDPLWDKHAAHLIAFADYVKKLNPKSNDLLGETLIELATKFQPGSFLLKKDKMFHTELRKVEKWQKEVSTANINRIVPLPERRKSLTNAQSATALAFSTEGLKTYSLPTQAKTNLESALARFGGSYFSNMFSRFSNRANVIPASPHSAVVKTIFKSEPSKLISKSDSSAEKEISVSKSYLQSRIRADSTSVFKPDSTPKSGYKKSGRALANDLHEEPEQKSPSNRGIKK